MSMRACNHYTSRNIRLVCEYCGEFACMHDGLHGPCCKCKECPQPKQPKEKTMHKNHVQDLRGKWGWRCDALYEWLSIWPAVLIWSLAGIIVTVLFYVLIHALFFGTAHAGQCDHELIATNTRYSACCLERDSSGRCTRKGQRACTDWRCKLCGHEPDATCTGCAP